MADAPIDVDGFLTAVEPTRRQADGLILNKLFQKITGWKPRMWGPTIVGYGEYHYVYDSGREGDSLVTGFSPRKANLVMYIMPGYENLGDKLANLGKHKVGKSCLYINKLDDVDLNVLEHIIREGVDDMQKRYPVKPS